MCQHDHSEEWAVRPYVLYAWNSSHVPQTIPIPRHCHMLSLQNDSHCRHNVNNGNTACVLWCGGHTQHLPAQAQPPLQACIYSKLCVAECVWISILSTPCCRQQWSPGLIADDTTNVTLIADDSGQQLPPPLPMTRSNVKSIHTRWLLFTSSQGRIHTPTGGQ